MSLGNLSVTIHNMADEGDDVFERLLQESLHSLEEMGLKFKLKAEQKIAIRQLFKRQDLLAVLPTGFGKSLIFQLLVLVARRGEGGNFSALLVITPLTSIIKDQIIEVESLNLSACNLTEKLDNLRDIEEGKYHIVYASAESATDKRFLRSLKKDSVFTKSLVALVVDESHTVETWTGLRKVKAKKRGEVDATMAFRGAYGQLCLLRSFLKKGTPIAALTGTADKDTCSVIISQLAMRHPLTIRISPNRPNLRFSVVHTKKEEIFGELTWLINHIKEKGESASKTIIFCNTMNDIACVVNYLMLKLGEFAYSPNDSREHCDCLLGIYHSSCWQRSKDRVEQSFKSQGKVRVVVASTALSMGVNFPDTRYIVNWGPAQSLLDQHQEAGRAGRDGLPSHVLVIYHGQQLSHCEEDVKDFVKSTGCLRVAAYKSFDDSIHPQQPGHSCCSHCSLSCNCNQCESSKPLFEGQSNNQSIARESLLTRPVSNQDKIDLTDSLKEVQDSLIRRQALFDGVSCHGFSDQLVQDVVANCHQLFTLVDILELCPVFSIHHALRVLEIIQEVFLDIPSFDNIMDVIRLDDSSHCDNLESLLKDASLLADESPSEEEDDFVEVLTL